MPLDAVKLVPAIILSSVQEKDVLYRMFGRCLQGRPIDRKFAAQQVSTSHFAGFTPGR